jgi:PAS domain-containing protein
LAQHPIEIILLRQWASCIAVPVWIADAEGNLIYYNEPAEPILGVRFEDAGELAAEDLAERFSMCNLDGTPISNHDRPLMIALTKQVPAHRRIRLCGADQRWREIEATAIPISSQGRRHLGAMATFWDDSPPGLNGPTELPLPKIG